MKTLTLRIDDETEEAIAHLVDHILEDDESFELKKTMLKTAIKLHRKSCKEPNCAETCEEYQTKALKELEQKERIADLLTKMHARLSLQDAPEED